MPSTSSNISKVVPHAAVRGPPPARVGDHEARADSCSPSVVIPPALAATKRSEVARHLRTRIRADTNRSAGPHRTATDISLLMGDPSTTRAPYSTSHFVLRLLYYSHLSSLSCANEKHAVPRTTITMHSSCRSSVCADRATGNAGALTAECSHTISYRMSIRLSQPISDVRARRRPIVCATSAVARCPRPQALVSMFLH